MSGQLPLGGTSIIIPPGTPERFCSSCGSAIYWIRTATGKLTPVEPDGEPHWATCPHAATHRKPRSKR